MFLSKGLAVAGSIIFARNSTCDNCVRSHSGTSDKSQKDKSSPGLLLTSHRQQNVLVRQDRCKSNSATIHSQSPRNSDTAKCIFLPKIGSPLKHLQRDCTIGASSGFKVAGPRLWSFSTLKRSHRDIRLDFGAQRTMLRKNAMIFSPVGAYFAPSPYKPSGQWYPGDISFHGQLCILAWLQYFSTASSPISMQRFPKR